MRCPTLDDLPKPASSRVGWPFTQESPLLSRTLTNGQEWPSVSIVTPSHNQGAFLEQTLRSVLLQNYPNLEYSGIDGGSEDGSLGLILKYAPFLTYWHSRQDAGQADAIRYGFERSTGEILGWLNSDDILLPGCLQEVGRYFAHHPEVDCVVGGAMVIDSVGKTVRNQLGLPRIVRGERETCAKMRLRRGTSFCQPASFWRREAYLAVGGLDTGLMFVMDTDLYLRLCRGKPFGHISSLLACFRLHTGSKTAQLQEVRRRERELLVTRYGLDSIGPIHLALGRLCLDIYNFGNNLPIRLGVVTGLVATPFDPSSRVRRNV